MAVPVQQLDWWPTEVGRGVLPRATCVLYISVSFYTGNHQIQKDCKNAAGEFNVYAKRGDLIKH